jgi:hypothetical protein
MVVSDIGTPPSQEIRGGVKHHALEEALTVLTDVAGIRRAAFPVSNLAKKCVVAVANILAQTSLCPLNNVVQTMAQTKGKNHVDGMSLAVNSNCKWTTLKYSVR